jgi:hypothetical protein
MYEPDNLHNLSRFINSDPLANLNKLLVKDTDICYTASTRSARFAL